ncbi:MAG: hypothetical protein CM1200mP12_04400 [Gammaproteobacteria bacterium]|nr:MAG: hypothetical protein CM1200mP12_04400 [Gammaproteobacteria bacterium]
MSKSKGNIVDPNEVIELYGADTLRLFVMFVAPLISLLSGLNRDYKELLDI